MIGEHAQTKGSASREKLEPNPAVAVVFKPAPVLLVANGAHGANVNLAGNAHLGLLKIKTRPADSVVARHEAVPAPQDVSGMPGRNGTHVAMRAFVPQVSQTTKPSLVATVEPKTATGSVLEIATGQPGVPGLHAQQKVPARAVQVRAKPRPAVTVVRRLETANARRHVNGVPGKRGGPVPVKVFVLRHPLIARPAVNAAPRLAPVPEIVPGHPGVPVRAKVSVRRA